MKKDLENKLEPNALISYFRSHWSIPKKKKGCMIEYQCLMKSFSFFEYENSRKILNETLEIEIIVKEISQILKMKPKKFKSP